MGALPFDLYLVVGGGPRELSRALAVVEAAPPGRLAVQARWKDAPPDEAERYARVLAEAAARRAVPVLVNGSPALAAALGAGLHLTEAGPGVEAARAGLAAGALIGASCHDEAGVRRRAAEGADFVVLGPLGEVPGKGPPLAPARFEAIAREAPVPVLALGGVRDARDVARAIGLGARGIAVQRALLEADDPRPLLAALLDALERAR